MFIIRFITIIFLLILSPIMVMGSLIPKLSEQTSKWWKEIMEQAIFAPVFMVMTWVVLSILNSPGFVMNNQTFVVGDQRLSALYEGNFAGAQFLLLNFVIAIALIISTLTISKSFSSKGGSMGGTFAGAVLGGGVGLAGRKTLGSFSRRVADSDTLKAQAANEGGKYSRLQQMKAKAYLKTAQSGAKSSFDLRGANSSLSKTLGAGSASGKGGYDEILKKEKEREVKFGESLKPSGLVLERAKEEAKTAEKQLDERRRFVSEEVDKKFKKSPEQERLERNLNAATTLANNPSVNQETRDLARQRAQVIQLDLDKINKNYQERRKEKVEGGLEKEKQRVRETLDRKDSLLGVDEEEAKKRVREVLKMSKSEMTEEDIDKYLDSDEGKREIAIIQQDKAENVRKKSYAEAITNPGASVNVLGYDLSLGSPNRVGFFGKIKRKNLEAASELKKEKKKSVKDTLEEMLREEGSLPKSAPPPENQTKT
jgi:hypothetical protein